MRLIRILLLATLTIIAELQSFGNVLREETFPSLVQHCSSGPLSCLWMLLAWYGRLFFRFPWFLIFLFSFTVANALSILWWYLEEILEAAGLIELFWAVA